MNTACSIHLHSPWITKQSLLGSIVLDSPFHSCAPSPIPFPSFRSPSLHFFYSSVPHCQCKEGDNMPSATRGISFPLSPLPSFFPFLPPSLPMSPPPPSFFSSLLPLPVQEGNNKPSVLSILLSCPPPTVEEGDQSPSVTQAFSLSSISTFLHLLSFPLPY